LKDAGRPLTALLRASCALPRHSPRAGLWPSMRSIPAR
jgi:hypothetical protein